MELTLIWFIWMFLWFVLRPWLIRLNSKSSDKLNTTAIKEYLYDKIDFANRFDIGSTFSRGDYIVVYNKLKNNGFVGEKLVISNHPLKGKSHEIVMEYLNDDIIVVKLDNQTMDSDLSVDNDRSAHKILELGQRAFKGKPIP